MQSEQEQAIKIAGTIGLVMALSMPTQRKVIKAATAVANANRNNFK